MRANVIVSICAAGLLAVSMPAQGDSDRPADRTNGTGAEHPEVSARVRLRAYLRAHPRLFRSLKREADQDGDGKLSDTERQALLRMAHDHMAKAREAREERREDRQERIEESHPGAVELLDRNGDGKVGPLEAERARRIHDWADRNDDGKVGPLEAERARKIHDWADRNDDGKVGPLERARAKEVKDRVDRNDDGKVQPRELRRARATGRRNR